MYQTKEMVLYSGQAGETIQTRAGKMRFEDWVKTEQERILANPIRKARIERAGLGVVKLVVNCFEYDILCTCHACKSAQVVLY